jgi:hypothetical protein
MSKCYDNPDYDDTSSDIQNTWNQHHKVEQELKKNFYCGDKVDYDEQCLEQCDGCVDSTGVDYGYLPEEIHLEDIFNDEKKEGIKKLIQKQKLITMMEQDEQLGLYEEIPEEVAERLIPLSSVPRKWFVRGAKWQQKRSYSEEEVLELLASYAEWTINGDCLYYEWFEQFKKK